VVYAEAMWWGLPCVGSTADAAGQVIVDGETGVFVPYDDADALARARGVHLRALPGGSHGCTRGWLSGDDRDADVSSLRSRLSVAWLHQIRCELVHTPSTVGALGSRRHMTA